jgi:hypothetical protein
VPDVPKVAAETTARVMPARLWLVTVTPSAAPLAASACKW